MPATRAVISVVGPDQKGIVAKFATFLAERGINIEDIEQLVVQGQFIMDMVVDLADMTASLPDVSRGLAELGQQIQMSVRMNYHERGKHRRIVVLAGKDATALRRLLDDQKAGRFQDRGRVVAVISGQPELETLAKSGGAAFELLANLSTLAGTLAKYEPDVIVLAHYDGALPREIVEKYAQRLMTVHASLLPRQPGQDPYRDAWESGRRITGCTVHFVTGEADQGPTILQDVLHIDVGRDTAEDVQRRGVALEAQVLSLAVQMFLDEKLVVIGHKVILRPGLSTYLDRDMDWQAR